MAAFFLLFLVTGVAYGRASGVNRSHRDEIRMISEGMASMSYYVVMAFVAAHFRDQGYTVQINDPYQGGDLVRTFGAPADGVHAIQVEVNRAQYMDEAAFTKSADFARLRAACASCVQALATYAKTLA